MKSFFRSAADVTSSSTSAEDTTTTDDDHEADETSEGLRRIRTFHSGEDDSQGTIGRTHIPPQAGSQEFHKDLMLHSLLEDKSVAQALETLNSNSAGRTYKSSDHEVQELAKLKYLHMTDQLSTLGVLSSSYSADGAKDLRHRYRQGLDYISQQHDIERGAIPGRGTSSVLPSILSQESLSSKFLQLGIAPSPGDTPSNLQHLQRHAELPLVLQPYVDLHPVFNSSRYNRDFIVLGVLGKGGYGQVFKCMHRLDGMTYAIKQIVVSPARINKIQSKGQTELDEVLKELRTVARLEHPNIVRYYGGWLEFTKNEEASFQTVAAQPGQKLLEAPPDLSIVFEHDAGSPSFQAGVETDLGNGSSVVFEDSSQSKDSESSAHALGSVKSRSGSIYMKFNSCDRRASTNTFSSTHSKRSLKSKNRQQSASGTDEFDEEIESIPRDMRALELTSSALLDPDSSKAVFDPSLLPPGSMATQIHKRSGDGNLTLHIQMGIHPSTLSHYLSTTSKNEATTSVPFSHCFHPQISVRILLSILDGVQYLHSAGVVHRDLKPSNIFLSVCEGALAPAGCVNISSCRECSRTNSLTKPCHLSVKIGDFGLVTAIARPEEEGVSGKVARAVGTEFYRPPVCSGTASQKLDVYAMGVIGFELLWKFGTRMERIETLRALKLGKFPSEFAESLGTEMGKDIESCLRDMLHCDEAKRITCDELREKLSKILASLDASGT